MPRIHKKFPATAFIKTPQPSAFRLVSAGICLLAAAALAPQANAVSVTKAAAGTSHSLYLTDDGTLWAVGTNWYGQVGDGTTTDRNTFVQVATGVIDVFAGGG